MNKCPQCGRRFDGVAFACPQCRYTPDIQDGIECFAPDFDAVHTGYPADVFDRLYEVEDRNFWFRARNRLILWALARFFPVAANFLEVGCGTGFVLNAVSHARPALRLTGSEIFHAGLRCARRRLGVRARLIQMDALRIPFESEFDVVGVFDVLEHIDDDQAVLARIYEALRPGGGVMITVPQHQWLWSHLDEIARHRRRYTRRGLLAKMRQAGFACAYATSFMSLLAPLMLASRLRRMNLDRAREELTLPAPLNGMLAAVAAVELAGVQLGLRYPVGGSLLVVGLKPR